LQAQLAADVRAVMDARPTRRSKNVGSKADGPA
jgi:hypothetical protein